MRNRPLSDPQGSPAPRASWPGVGPSDRPARSGSARAAAGLLSADLRADKVLALGDLARERARDLVRGPIGNIARERVIALFEDAIATQRAEPARRT